MQQPNEQSPQSPKSTSKGGKNTETSFCLSFTCYGISSVVVCTLKFSKMGIVSSKKYRKRRKWSTSYLLWSRGKATLFQRSKVYIKIYSLYDSEEPRTTGVRSFQTFNSQIITQAKGSFFAIVEVRSSHENRTLTPLILPQLRALSKTFG